MTGAVCCLAMVTGLTLKLHLACFDDPAEHDSEHCSICQELLIAPSKFVPASQPELGTATQFEHHVEFPTFTCSKRLYPQPANPRAPPVALQRDGHEG